MSAYPTDQRCPRCQYPVAPGATACANCGLAFQAPSGAYPGSNPAYPMPPTQAAPPGPSYGTLPSADPYAAGGPGAYGSGQPSTYYNPQGTLNNAPTVNSSLYPQGQPGYSGSQQPAGYPPPPPAYPGSQPQGGFGAPPPTYPGSQPQGGFGTGPGYSGGQPQGGFGTGPGYPGSQPDGGFGAPPTYPGSQQPGGFGAPPTVLAPPQQKGGRGLMIAIIAIVVVVVLGGGGAAAYIFTRPKPVITFDKTAPGAYAVGTTPAGSTGTSFCISGTKFSGNSTVTFLLDGQPTPDNGTASTNSDGAITNGGGSNACQSSQDFALTVSSKWGMGPHTLTAKDASGYATQGNIALNIVAQGDANTPGPNGAPTNSANFSVTATVQPMDSGQSLGSYMQTLKISNGAVCQDADNGSPQTINGTINTSTGPVDYVETATYKCTGTYKAGQLMYKETAVSAEFSFPSLNLNCSANTPYTEQELDGTFSSATSVSGNFMSDQIAFNDCTGHFDPLTGTWSGTAGG